MWMFEGKEWHTEESHQCIGLKKGVYLACLRNIKEAFVVGED